VLEFLSYRVMRRSAEKFFERAGFIGRANRHPERVPARAEASAEPDNAGPIRLRRRALAEDAALAAVERGVHERVLVRVGDEGEGQPACGQDALLRQGHTSAFDGLRVAPGAHFSDAAAAGLVERGPDGVERRATRTVDAHQAGLPVVEIRFVAEQEEQDRAHGHVSGEVADRVCVDACLRRLVCRLDVLAADIGGNERLVDADLPAELVESEGDAPAGSQG
jgi:hypothetical protein